MMKTLVTVSAALVLSSSALAADDMVIEWNNATLDAIRIESTNPPIATRHLAMVHVAIYDAVNAIDRAHEPFMVDVTAPEMTSREAAAAAAAHRVLVHLYPELTSYFDDYLYEMLKRVADSPAKVDGIELGIYVADQVIAARSGDGWDATVEYTPGNGPGEWQPTPPNYAPALLPHWPNVTPWAMDTGDQFRAPGPPALDSAEYAADWEEVRSLGAIDSQTRTEDQSQIAQFWADGPGTATPPGHWNVIAQNCSSSLGYGLGKNALLFAKLNVSLADAAISAWDSKYAYELWRPVHAIWWADQDGNPLTDPDPNWFNYVETPPFPEYTSGHSTFSGAAARMLAHEFGTDAMNFIDFSDGLPGVYREFTSFEQAADEAGRSRVYGGIHYEFSNRHGLEAGRELADHVQANYFQPMNNNSLIMMYPTYFRTEYINVFEAFHAPPGELVVFLWSHAQNVINVPRCPGVTINLHRPRVFRKAHADANGYAVASRVVPRSFRDKTRYGQAIVKRACETSNVVEGFFPR